MGLRSVPEREFSARFEFYGYLRTLLSRSFVQSGPFYGFNGNPARKLRLLGFDCLYRNDYSDPEIIRIALEQQRTVLTSDRGILKHARLNSGLLIRFSRDVEQVAQVLNRYQLWLQIALRSRCVSCNGLLERVAKEQIVDRLKAQTAEHCHCFSRCRECGQLYWRDGAHRARIEAWLKQLDEMKSIAP
jgi:uncharacterized protein with PIN domain